MESTEKIMCLHALERMFYTCLLVDFKLVWNVNELLRSLKFNHKQPWMTRYKKSARKHNVETQYIYSKKITSA